MDWPIPHRRQAGEDSQSWKGAFGPRQASYTKRQADFIANQDFLGFWMIDIRREGRNSPEETHGTPEKVCPLYTQKTEWLGRGRG